MRRSSKLMAVVLSALFSTPALAASVVQRQQNQQARIAQGVRSGQLTAREAVRLERQEAAVHRQIVRDRLDGGGFTPAERAKSQAKLNRMSAQINRQKHDGQRR